MYKRQQQAYAKCVKSNSDLKYTVGVLHTVLANNQQLRKMKFQQYAEESRYLEGNELADKNGIKTYVNCTARQEAVKWNKRLCKCDSLYEALGMTRSAAYSQGLSCSCDWDTMLTKCGEDKIKGFAPCPA